ALAMHPNEHVLNEFVDDALGSAERAEVERHLTTCAACRQQVDELEELRRHVTTLAPMQPPDRVWRRIERELQRSADVRGDDGAGKAAPYARSAWKRGTTPLWLAAAAILVIGTIVGVRF